MRLGQGRKAGGFDVQEWVLGSWGRRGKQVSISAEELGCHSPTSMAFLGASASLSPGLVAALGILFGT